MKFKIDENLPEEVVVLFEQAKHEAVTAPSENLGGASDPEIVSACQREERVLVTLDTDFANIRTYPPHEYAGLIVLRLQRQEKPHVLQVLSSVISKFATEPLQGRLWIVDEHRIRVRE